MKHKHRFIVLATFFVLLPFLTLTAQAAELTVTGDSIASEFTLGLEASEGPGRSLEGVTASPSQDAEEKAFLTLINQYRKSKGKAALTLNQNLNNASNWMSSDMAGRNYFNHTDSQGRSPFQRMRVYGYNYRAAGENIAAGYTTASAVMAGWKASPGHNTNMLNSAFKEIGIARAYNPSSKYQWYWTTKFGSR